MMIDERKAKAFWKARARQYQGEDSARLTNLEEDERLERMKVRMEMQHIFGVLRLDPSMVALELGSGIGAWCERLAGRCKEVVGVEFCEEMVAIARERMRRKGVGNVSFVVADAAAFTSARPFDVVFLSGILLYLPDERLERLADNVQDYSKSGTQLLLREPTGVQGRYELENVYSEALGLNYSAVYRSREELVVPFQERGFRLCYDKDMFEEGSPLNKWRETRLRVYYFLK